ncbi:MAG: diguanylate cyclase [Pseudohongiellaceae bacterium]
MTDRDKQRERDLAIALQQCGSEPVHIPGSIQPHGALLVFDTALRSVQQCSDNLRAVIGIDPAELLGGTEYPPNALLDTLTAQLSSLSLSESFQTRRLFLPMEDGERHFHLGCWLSDTGPVAELQAMVQSPPGSWIDAMTHWSAQLESCQSQDTLLQTLTEIVQGLSGYDRVMVYRFDKEWNGQVIAESLASATPGYLGHRFPASDIPPQVRQLYSVNPVRMIVDSEATASRLLARDDGREPAPLDLSPGLLRGVSPIHLTYLQNMGVRASFSIALFSRGKLWGLLACHHGSSVSANPSALQAANLLARLSGQRRELLEHEEQSRYFQQVLRSRRRLLQENSMTPGELVDRNGSTWLQLFRACGGALVYEEQPLQCWEDTPSEPVVREIIRQLQSGASRNAPWYNNNLAKSELSLAEYPDDHTGLLALPLVSARFNDGWLLFFRREQLQLQQWAGPPKDQPSYVDGRPVLAPRQSFDSWQQRVEGYSEAWLDTEILAAQELAENLSTALAFHGINDLNSQLEQVNEQLQTMVRTDPLTGIWNRYYIQEELVRQVEVSSRYGHPFSVIFFDIDRFKLFNDRHGHQAGDRVLRSITGELRDCLRASDVLGRWGGEEFIIVAGNTALEDALELAERVRAAVAGLDMGDLGHVTISLGVTEWHQGDTGIAVIDRADLAMYRAKSEGRNRVALPADGD